MLTTTNLGLKKIELTDSPPDITAINPNWDIIDEKLKESFDNASDWDRFKKSGGTIAGDVTLNKLISEALTIKKFSGTEALIETLLNQLSFKAASGLGGVLLEAGTFRPFSSLSNKMELGTPEARWKNLYLGAFNKSLGGYTTLPNGMIMQWGYTHTATSLTITFPITHSTNSSYVFVASPYGVDATGLTWRLGESKAENMSIYATKQTPFYWMTIGW